MVDHPRRGSPRCWREGVPIVNLAVNEEEHWAPEETVELPELLGRYFWDYAPGRLTWPETREAIVTRLLQTGEFDAVRWLRRNVGDRALGEFIIARRGSGMDPKRLCYWGLILELPQEQVDAWVQTARKNPAFQRTRPRREGALITAADITLRPH